ncbi:hypothetical protein KHQ82_05890 [Mycoplasmatota bacterium]|nr:hypothetical protein KHQ82_05890 [Mycoplasmatota bacterium]
MVFKSHELLKEKLEIELIPLPIYIEINYYNGIAPCGFCLLISDFDLAQVKSILFLENITIDKLIRLDEF